jgi:hypothetical protein
VVVGMDALEIDRGGFFFAEILDSGFVGFFGGECIVCMLLPYLYLYV